MTALSKDFFDDSISPDELYEKVINAFEQKDFFLPDYLKTYSSSVNSIMLSLSTKNLSQVHASSYLSPVNSVSQSSKTSSDLIDIEKVFIYINTFLQSLPDENDILSVNSAAFAQYLILDFKPSSELDILVSLTALTAIADFKITHLQKALDYYHENLNSSAAPSLSLPVDIAKLKRRYVYLQSVVNELQVLTSKQIRKEAFNKSAACKKYAAFSLANQQVSQHYLVSDLDAPISPQTATGSPSILNRILNQRYMSIGTDVQTIIDEFLGAYFQPSISAPQEVEKILEKFDLFKPRNKNNFMHLGIINNYFLLASLSYMEKMQTPPINSLPQSLNLSGTLRHYCRLASNEKNSSVEPFLTQLQKILPYTYSAIDFEKTHSTIKSQEPSLPQEKISALCILAEKQALNNALELTDPHIKSATNNQFKV